MSDRHMTHKVLIAPLRRALYEGDAGAVRAALHAIMAPDVLCHMPHPFGDLIGVDALFDTCYAPLFAALPDLEARDWIRIGGPDQEGADWVGCAGHFMGTFAAPWCDIPPTGHAAHMRYHEFYRFEKDKIIEVQAIWDIPEMMMQAGAWPMVPSLGREMCVPAPATSDGIQCDLRDENLSQVSCAHVIDMLTHMIRHPAQGGPEVMEMERFWHPKMNWYGPAGIGTARGITGFRNWHQIPFLKAMPDRGQYPDEVTHHFFGDGNYVAVTGWPNMAQTLSHDGWLGLAPTGQKITLRSLDFWRLEQGLIRENWVLVDLLDVYAQLGIDVFARLRAFNTSRTMGRTMGSIPAALGEA